MMLHDVQVSDGGKHLEQEAALGFIWISRTSGLQRSATQIIKITVQSRNITQVGIIIIIIVIEKQIYIAPH